MRSQRTWSKNTTCTFLLSLCVMPHSIGVYIMIVAGKMPYNNINKDIFGYPTEPVVFWSWWLLEWLWLVNIAICWIWQLKWLLYLLLSLLLLFQHIWVNDCRSIHLTDIIHTLSSKTLDFLSIWSATIKRKNRTLTDADNISWFGRG